MYEFSVSPELVLLLVAGGLALAFDYFPKLNQWFETQSPEKKRLINVGLVAGTAIVIFAGDCVSIFVTNLECTIKGGVDLVYMIFLAVTVNQGVHKGLKPTQSLKERLLK